MSRFPLNLQFFAEGDGGGASDTAASQTQQTTQTQQPAANPAQNTQPVQQPNANDIAEAIFKAAESRTQRAEAGVVKSMADQYGITEAEAKAALEKVKAEKAQKLPDEVQKKLDEAEAKVRNMQISAEVAKIGAELGLVDAETAMLLIPADKIKVDDKGVSGVKEALEELKKTKPYLFRTPGAMAQRVSGQAASSEDELSRRMADAIRGGRPPKPDDKK